MSSVINLLHALPTTAISFTRKIISKMVPWNIYLHILHFFYKRARCLFLLWLVFAIFLFITIWSRHLPLHIRDNSFTKTKQLVNSFTRQLIIYLMVITLANGFQNAMGTVAGWHENQPLCVWHLLLRPYFRACTSWTLHLLILPKTSNVFIKLSSPTMGVRITNCLMGITPAKGSTTPWAPLRAGMKTALLCV